MMKTLSVEDAARNVRGDTAKPRKGLLKAWMAARARKAAAEELVVARAQKAELGRDLNEALAQAKELRAKKLAASPKEFKDGFVGWARFAGEAEGMARELDQRAGTIHAHFSAACVREQDLIGRSGEKNDAHESELRRRREAAAEANAALAAYEAKEAAGRKQQAELEVLEAPPV